MQKTDLRTELDKAQTKRKQEAILREAISILGSESCHENSVLERIENRMQGQTAVMMALLDPSAIYEMEPIKQVCIEFRLRFLESNLFKGEIPSEAIRTVKRIESNTGLRFTRFHVIAPAERFRLKDSSRDPILLAELPNNKYYFIYQWGNELDWYEYFLKYPFRHMSALAGFASLAGIITALAVPQQFADLQSDFFYRFFIFSVSAALVMTSVIILGIIYSKDFSENIWNSRYIR